MNTPISRTPLNGDKSQRSAADLKKSLAAEPKSIPQSSGTDTVSAPPPVAPLTQEDLNNPLVDDIIEHARTWYAQDGWDILIETKTKEEVALAIRGATTHRGAIIKVRRAFQLIELDRQRKEAQAAGE